MDDPHAIASQDHATWQSEAEKQSDNHHPSWRRMVGFGAAAIVAAALIAAGIAMRSSTATSPRWRRRWRAG